MYFSPSSENLLSSDLLTVFDYKNSGSIVCVQQKKEFFNFRFLSAVYINIVRVEKFVQKNLFSFFFLFLYLVKRTAQNISDKVKKIL